MSRFGWRYATRNALHYRAKYAINFALIAGFCFCLALALFAFDGFWQQAGSYARSWGDITFYANPGMIDRAGASSPGEAAGAGSPWERVLRSLPEFFRDELKATKWVSASFINGDGYFKSGTRGLAAMDLGKAAQLWGVELAEGRLPNEGEALLPSALRRSLAVGDSVTFVFKNRDTILNSLQFRISGFFLPAGRYSEFLYVNAAQFAALDEGRPDDVIFVFLPNGGAGRELPDDSVYLSANSAFRGLVGRVAGGPAVRYLDYATARNRFKDSAQIIDFFELIIAIFLAAFVVVAVATIVNVLFIALVDRIRIVGTFMAFGMKRRSAIFLLASETLAFALVACTLGVLAALAATGPASSLKFTADNWTIAVILGGKRSLTIRPSLTAAAATYLAGTAIPFAVAILSAARMLKGDVVRLLHFAK